MTVSSGMVTSIGFPAAARLQGLVGVAEGLSQGVRVEIGRAGVTVEVVRMMSAV
jgi:hypothetical protein